MRVLYTKREVVIVQASSEGPKRRQLRLIEEDNLPKEPKESFEPICLGEAPKVAIEALSRTTVLLTRSFTTAFVEPIVVGSTGRVT